MHIKRRDQRYVQLLSMSPFLHTLFDINLKLSLDISTNFRSVVKFVKPILIVGLSLFCFVVQLQS